MITGAITPGLVEKAQSLADRSRTESRAEGLDPVSHAGGVSGSYDNEGRLGEFIAAYAFGLPEPRLGTYKREPDVGPFEIQAVSRTRSDCRRTSLIIRPSDLQQGCATRPYVLVVLYDDDTFEIPGWLRGNEGPTLGREWDEGRHPCWQVDKTVLHPVDIEFWQRLSDWRITHLVTCAIND